MTDKADYNQTGISKHQVQHLQSLRRLYRIFDGSMIHAVRLLLSSATKIGLFILLVLVSWQCLDAPDFPNEPYIEFLDISKDTLRQGLFQEDSVIIRFRFEDGDGDIGRTDQATQNNIFVYDERTGVLDNTFGIPAIPQEGAANGVEGEVRIKLYSTCCIYPDGADPCTINPNYPFDIVQYRIYIQDRAGNKSNEILTSPIILRCN